MKSVNYFTDTLSDGRKFNHWQNENGMYQAEIRNQQNIVESGTVCKTLNEIWKWVKEHE